MERYREQGSEEDQVHGAVKGVVGELMLMTSWGAPRSQGWGQSSLWRLSH